MMTQPDERTRHGTYHENPSPRDIIRSRPFSLTHRHDVGWSRIQSATRKTTSISEIMQALSMHQPWASLVAKQMKHIETRDRRPPLSLIGQRIAIHATKRIVTFNPDEATYPAERQHIERFNQAVAQALGPDWSTRVPTGAVLASVQQVKTPDDLPDDPNEQLFGDYATGRWLWHLRDVLELTHPVPARGYPSFWTWTTAEEQCLC